jgi:hypothetical protein
MVGQVAALLAVGVEDVGEAFDGEDRIDARRLLELDLSVTKSGQLGEFTAGMRQRCT